MALAPMMQAQLFQQPTQQQFQQPQGQLQGQPQLQQQQQAPQSTYLTQHGDIVNFSLRVNVLTPLAVALKNNCNLTVSVEQMAAWLNIPAPVSSTSLMGIGSAPAPSFGGNAFLGGAMHGTGAISNGSGKGRTAKQAAPGTPACRYRFGRGDRVGQECGAPADPSTGYCKACSKKKTVSGSSGGVGGGIGVTGGSQVMPPAIPNMNYFANGAAIPQPAPVQEPQQEQLSAAYTADKSLRETKYGFILVQSEAGTYVTTHIQPDPNNDGDRRPLTPAEKEVAKRLKLGIVEAATSAPAMVQTQFQPQVQQQQQQQQQPQFQQQQMQQQPQVQQQQQAYMASPPINPASSAPVTGVASVASASSSTSSMLPIPQMPGIQGSLVPQLPTTSSTTVAAQ